MMSWPDVKLIPQTNKLEIEEYAGVTSRIHSPAYAARRNGSIEQKDSFTLQAEFRYLVVFTAGLLSPSPRNQ